MIRLLLIFLPFFCFADSFNLPYHSYTQTLSNLEDSHSSQAILFSATPGMGKSSISQELSAHYGAVVISCDGMRLTLKALGIYSDERTTSENEKILHQFAAYTFDRLFHEYPNHFYIFDSSVDRRYYEIKHWLDTYAIPSLLIRLEVPREVVEKRLIKREDIPEHYLRNLDEWFQDYESFDLSVVDLFFDNTQPLDISSLVDQINFALNYHSLENSPL